MYQVEWTEYAKDTYAELLIDLMNKSLDAAIALDEKIEKLTEYLATHRYLCPPASKVPRYRRCVVTKNASLVYEVRGNQIFIIAVVDNRAQQLFF